MLNTDLNLEKKPPAWRETTVDERLWNARGMLKIHGLLSEAESDRVIARHEKLRRIYIEKRDKGKTKD